MLGSRILDLEVDVWRTCRSLLSIDPYLILKQTHAYNTMFSYARVEIGENVKLLLSCAAGMQQLDARD
jgi:hypothetical protein